MSDKRGKISAGNKSCTKALIKTMGETMEKYIDEIFEEMREAQNKFFAESPSKIIEISIIISKTFLEMMRL